MSDFPEFDPYLTLRRLERGPSYELFLARHASLAPPVSGSWHGVGSDAAGMAVDVQVTRR